MEDQIIKVLAGEDRFGELRTWDPELWKAHGMELPGLPLKME